MGKIYAAIAVIFGLIAAIFTAFFKGGQSKANEIKAETEEAAREYQSAGSDALIGGLENEAKVKDEKIDPDNPRDHFS